MVTCSSTCHSKGQRQRGGKDPPHRLQRLLRLPYEREYCSKEVDYSLQAPLTLDSRVGTGDRWPLTEIQFEFRPALTCRNQKAKDPEQDLAMEPVGHGIKVPEPLQQTGFDPRGGE
jgi:hypothetical protein